jgi:hypothetical protein
MGTRRVRPGQPLKIPAAEYNSILDAADAVAAGRFSGGKPQAIPATRSAGVIRIQNTTGDTVPIGGVLAIDGSFFDPAGDDTARLNFARTPTLTGIEPTAEFSGRFAVAIEPIVADGVGLAIAAGLVAVGVDVSDASHKFAEVGTTSANLVSGSVGSAQIVFRADPEATGIQPCLVRIGNRTTSPPLVRFTLEEDLLAGSTGAALINSDGADDDEAITVTDWAGNGGKEGDKGIAFDAGGGVYYVAEIKNRAEAEIVRFTLEEDMAPFGPAGASIVSTGIDDGESIDLEDWAGNGGQTGDNGVAWFSGGQYYVLEIKNRAEANLVRFTLEEDLSAGGTAGALINSTGPDDDTAITVTDWAGNGGKDGDKGVAWFSGGVYYVLEIKSRGGSPLIRFTLTADLARARGSEAAANLEGLIIGSPTAGTVINWGRHAAKSGARGTAFELSISDETTYWVVDVEPFADRIRGTIADDFETTDAEVVLEALKGLNGDSPTPDDVTVKNIHAWAGKTGDKARAEWNQTENQWELYQIDCEEGL